MSNSFAFVVSFYVTHPSISPEEITRNLTGLSPSLTVAVGSMERVSRGRLQSRSSPASQTTWQCDFPSERQNDSDVVPLSDYLKNAIREWLLPHREFISSIAGEGSIGFHVGCFMKGRCAGLSLDRELLDLLSEISASLELSTYSLDEQVD